MTTDKLLKEYAGKDAWLLVVFTNYYTGKMQRKALIRINKVWGDVRYNELPLDLEHADSYTSALRYLADNGSSVATALKYEYRTRKECVQIWDAACYTTDMLFDYLGR